MGSVSTHSRLKAAGRQYSLILSASACFNTQPPKGGWKGEADSPSDVHKVSTHSRLKAAGTAASSTACCRYRFNTQPPKGGWRKLAVIAYQLYSFNTQPPKGGWNITKISVTHTRGFNTQPPKGGWTSQNFRSRLHAVSTHSRLKAAGTSSSISFLISSSFNTQPPKGGWYQIFFNIISCWNYLCLLDRCSFNTQPPKGGWRPNVRRAARAHHVSTHSRLKAAGYDLRRVMRFYFGFNTQPPKGGWAGRSRRITAIRLFQHTAA